MPQPSLNEYFVYDKSSGELVPYPQAAGTPGFDLSNEILFDPSGNKYVGSALQSAINANKGGGLFGGISNALTNLFQPVEKAVTAGVKELSNAYSTKDAQIAYAIAAAYFLPGVGSALGQTLVNQGLITGAATQYATAIGTALAQTGASVAQGVPFDTALTNATVNAVTSTGSQSVAGYISKLGASPEVANAVTSVGASGLATAAKGGSAADIETNMKGALAGSTVAGLTGDKLSGAVVGGAVSGGIAGAVAPIAGSLIGSSLGGGADTAKSGAPPAGTVAVQDTDGKTLYTDGKTYYNPDGSVNTAATESAGVVSGVGTDVAGTATGMADKSAPGVSVGGSNLSLGTDSYGYRIPAGTKYANGLTYEGNGQWVLPDGRRMVVGSSAWGDSDDFGGINKFNPNQSYVTSFGTFGTSETGATGTSSGGTGTGGGGGSGTGGGAGGGSSVGGVGGGGAQTSDAQGVGTDSAIIDLLGLGGGANVGGNVVVDSGVGAGVGAGNVAGNVSIDTGETGNIGNATGNVVISDAGLGGGANAVVGADTSVSPADRDILILSGITPPGTSTVAPTNVTLPTDQSVIDLTGIGGGNVGGNVVVGPGADAGNITGNVVIDTGPGGGNTAGNVIVSDGGLGGGNAAGNVVVSDGGLGGGNAAGNVTISDGGLGGGLGNATGNVVVGPGTGTGGPGGNVTIDAGGGGDGNAAANVSGNVAITEDKPVVDDKKVVDEDKKDEPIDDTYTPDIFIYGKTTPKTKTRTTTDLSTTLQAPFYPTSTLGQALTGYRGAGEIEGKKTGKPRKNVWNEESLRLKDALGL